LAFFGNPDRAMGLVYVVSESHINVLQPADAYMDFLFKKLAAPIKPKPIKSMLNGSEKEYPTSVRASAKLAVALTQNNKIDTVPIAGIMQCMNFCITLPLCPQHTV
jgi:hypothetical protein